LIEPHAIEDSTTQAVKEITMHANGHTTVWGTHIGIGRASETRSWYQQLRDWWTAHKATRQQTSRDALHRCWDAKREGVRTVHAEAAIDLVAAAHAGATIIALSSLSV
jgi:hypothetical protein